MRFFSLAAGVIMLPALQSVAQVTFQKAIGAEGYEKGSALKPLSEGGFIIAGEADRGADAPENDMLMMRTDASGNVIWTKAYGGPEREVINDVVQTPEGGFMAVGEKYQPNKNEGEFLTLLKTDAAGNLLWKKIFDEGGNETEGFSMAASPDGSYIITGIVKSINIVSDAFFTMRGEDQSLFLLKVDGSGNKIWSRRLNPSSPDDIATTGVSVMVARDGSCMVAGNVTKKGRTDNKIEKPIENVSRDEARNMLLAKVNPDGTLAWAREYAASRITAGFSVIEKREGGFMVAGVATIDDTDNLDIFLMSTTPDGAMQWAKTFGGADFESVSDVLQAPDGGFIVSGITLSYGRGYNDALLLKTDSRGNLLWAKALGGTGIESGTRLALSDDGIIICGEVSSLPSESFDVMLLKADASGNSGCFSMDISIASRDFQPVSKKMERSQTVPVEKGIVPPNFKRADVSNISGQTRQVRVKNLCD